MQKKQTNCTLEKKWELFEFALENHKRFQLFIVFQWCLALQIRWLVFATTINALPGKYLLKYGDPSKNLNFSKTNQTETVIFTKIVTKKQMLACLKWSRKCDLSGIDKTANV